VKEIQALSFRSSSSSDVKSPGPATARSRGPAVTRRLIDAPTTSWDARIANHGVTAGLFLAALLVYGVVIPVELISKVT
jgi:hypothetical protein